MTNQEQDAVSAIAARFAASPAFAQALLSYSEGLAELRQGQRFLNKLLARDASWRVIGYLLFLDAGRDPLDANSGATYGRLHALCTHRGEVSPRTLKTMLALLRLGGFLRARTSASDRRLRIYQPTERLIGFVRRWLSYPVIALDILEPQGQRARRLREDPEFVRQFLLSGGRNFMASTPLTERMPEFGFFLDGQEGAMMTLLALLLAKMLGAPTPSRATIARQFGLSKTQVTRVVTAAAAQGFFAMDADGVPAPTPKTRTLYRPLGRAGAGLLRRAYGAGAIGRDARRRRRSVSRSLTTNISACRYRNKSARSERTRRRIWRSPSNWR